MIIRFVEACQLCWMNRRHVQFVCHWHSLVEQSSLWLREWFDSQSLRCQQAPLINVGVLKFEVIGLSGWRSVRQTQL